MRLDITIKKAPLGSHHMVGERFSFDGSGFSFGRASSNDLILPDPQSFVSSRHGLIEYADGQFTVFDQSSNGLYIDHSENPLGKGNHIVLEPGMQLKAGDYRLDVDIIAMRAADGPGAPAAEKAQLPPASRGAHSGELEKDMAIELALRLGLHGMSEDKLSAMPDEVTTLIRRCISSVMDVLSARRHAKTQLKMENTVIQRVHNNALKVSASADEAIERMFSKSSETYLSPEQALVEAFQDIGDHQVAMMAATLQVYQQVVERFEPSALESRLAESAGQKRMFSGKRKPWDEYKDQYESIAANGTENVHEAFLHEFSTAYSDQLLKLKRERGKNTQ
jgi:type VI secretion system protein ImpI